jgi:hypothetical protein
MPAGCGFNPNNVGVTFCGLPCQKMVHPMDGLSKNIQFNGGLPIESGTLADVNLDPKSLDFCWEIYLSRI